MPSPFPGMDPYLEGPESFQGFHAGFIIYLIEALQSRLPQPYYAVAAERTTIGTTRAHIEPDASIIREEVPTPRDRSGGVATAEAVATEPVVVSVPRHALRETYLELYTRKADEEQLITVVEVLSPANKTPGDGNRSLYVRKQHQVLESQVHLVEIDLLRGGTHTTAVPLDWLRLNVPVYDYHVCIHHFDNLEDFFVYPIYLGGRLPSIAIPLLPGDGSVTVDLQAVFTRTYDAGPYARRIRYAGPVPPPEMPPAYTEWVTKLLREKGLRPA